MQNTSLYNSHYSNGVSAWKTFDWDTMNRLHKKGYIFDPANKAKSVGFTEEGLHEAERQFKLLFAKD